jgi:hypothetical protein
MNPQVRAAIQPILDELTATATQRIIDVLNGLPLSALTGGGEAAATTSRKAAAPAKAKKSSSGRLAKRGPEEMQGVINRIVEALQGEQEGMSSEQLQKALGLAKNEIQRPLLLALQGSTVRKTGEKRATRYFSPFVGGAAKATPKAAPKKAAKKAAPKKPKKVKAKAAPKKKTAPKKPAAKPKKSRVHVEVVDRSKDTNSAPVSGATPA